MEFPVLILAAVAATPPTPPSHAVHQSERACLPNEAASKVVTYQLT